MRWRRVTIELFSSRVGSADIRRGAPALRETALSLTLFPKKTIIRILCGIFCVLAESKERTLQFACPRALPEETRHFHPVECAVISYSPYPNPIPRIKCGIFCALFCERLPATRSVALVYVKHPPKCHLKFLRNSTSVNPIAVEKFRNLCYNVEKYEVRQNEIRRSYFQNPVRI